jgi:hypothetical protein
MSETLRAQLPYASVGIGKVGTAIEDALSRAYRVSEFTPGTAVVGRFFGFRGSGGHLVLWYLLRTIRRTAERARHIEIVDAR